MAERSPRSPRRRSGLRERPRPAESATLRRASRVPIWADILIRSALVFGLIMAAVLVHWFDRAGLRDGYDGEISFVDVVYFTMISVTTTGYGDIAPVTEQARLFDALIVTPIRIAVVLIFVGTAYNFVIRKSWSRFRMKQIQARLKGHIVVCGFGVSGSQAVDELCRRGTDPATIVVVDPDTESLARAEAMGCNVLAADATRDQTLIDVKVATACSVIVSAGRDDTSILIVLTVRHLAPDAPISVVVRAADNELLARQAGANTVINPVHFAGLLLAGSCHGEHIADYLADLASVSGRVALAERRVRGDEVGMPLRAVNDGMGLRLYRDGKPFGFWEPEAQALEDGDMIVEIVPGDGRDG